MLLQHGRPQRLQQQQRMCKLQLLGRQASHTVFLGQDEP
jgi:hypothetical protein